jgi:hypothetical protein
MPPSKRRPTSASISRGAALAALVVLVGGAAWAGAQAESPTDPTVTVTTSDTSPGPPPLDPVTDVDAQQAASFAILGQAPAQGATVSPGAARAGANPALVRTATADNGETVSVIPASGQMCIADSHANTCNATSEAVEGYVVASEICGPWLTGGHTRIVGLVPDGVSSVTVATSGSPIFINVRDNVYVLDTASSPSSVSFGSQTIRVGDPRPASTCPS